MRLVSTAADGRTSVWLIDVSAAFWIAYRARTRVDVVDTAAVERGGRSALSVAA
jgi:hypothetical protein